MPGYSDSSASAIRWAELCHSVDMPSSSRDVRSLRVESPVKGLVGSHTSPLTSAASTLRASPSLMEVATSKEVVPSETSLTVPSGKVIAIMGQLFRPPKISRAKAPPAAPSQPLDKGLDLQRFEVPRDACFGHHLPFRILHHGMEVKGRPPFLAKLLLHLLEHIGGQRGAGHAG